MRNQWRKLALPAVVLIGLLAGAVTYKGEAHPTAGRPAGTYTAYFYKLDPEAPLGTFLVPVRFPLPEGAAGTEPLRLAFQALCDKAPAGLHSEVKQGCRVGSVGVGPDGALVVDFTAGAVFPRGGTTTDAMVLEQLALTASQFPAPRMKVAFQGQVPTDMGGHGVGNNFAVTGRSSMFLVTPPAAAGQKVETASLSPRSAAVQNATRALSAPLLGAINRRLSEEGRTAELAREVAHIIPSGDGSLWVTVSRPSSRYRLWWTGREWQVEG